MRLLPNERQRLDLFLAAELARRRRARGLLLSQAEAVALIGDEVMEAARDGLGYAAVERRGYEVLTPADVLPGVERLVGRVELEPLFGDGHRLIVLHDPVLRDAPPPADAVGPATPWLDADVRVGVTNEAAVPAGVKVVVAPGESIDLPLVPIGGDRIVRGHGGLVDGPLDEPGALEAALALARERGYLGA